MNKLSKIIFLCAGVLIAYGYMCRLAKLYFFWDSKFVGWFLFFVGVFLILVNKYRIERHKNRETIWLKFAIAPFILGFIITPFIINGIKHSDAYAFSTDYIRNDSAISKDVGTIEGFGLFPTGSIQGRESSLSITVKGSKKYRDVYIQARQEPSSIWHIVEIE